MKNKIISILCFFILISFLFINNSVFAGENTITEDALNSILNFVYNNQYYLDGYTNVYIAPAYSTSYAFDVILVPNNDTGKYHLAKGDRLLFIVDGNVTAYTSIRYGFYSDGTIRESFVDSPVIDTSGTQCRAAYLTPLYSTFDIYNDGNDTEIFFQKTPVQLGVVAQKLEGVKMNPLKEMLTLVPIMIILIVSYLGLRKGLTLLKKLRKM